MASPSATKSNPSDYIFKDPSFAFALGQLAGKVEGLTNEIAESNKRNSSHDKEFDDRLTRLEKKGWIQQGVLVAVSVAGSAIVQWVIYRGIP